MLRDRLAIISLCAQFGRTEGMRPLTTAEYRDLSGLLARFGKIPGELLTMAQGELKDIGISSEAACRIEALLGRTDVIEALLDSYRAMGIGVLTPAEEGYSPTIKATLGQSCPPVLCCAGNPILGMFPAVGFVGARDIDERDKAFALETVQKVVSRGYGVVSGGARGADSAAEGEALRQGAFVVEFPATSLLQKLRNPETVRLLEQGDLLLMTPEAPQAGFSNSLAAARNRLIYAHSLATVVVRATHCKGGTWSGATHALKKELCPVLCRNYPYEGNQDLIQNGAVAIDESWDGVLPAEGAKTVPEQFSIF